MILEFEGIENARDLGGTVCADGRRVKMGKLLRSARLWRASEADIARLRDEFALAHIVDFRDRDELKKAPDAPVPGAENHSLPALPPFAPATPGQPRRRDPRDFDKVFRQIYSELAQTDIAASAYRAFFRILLESGGKTVLWHCTQGKDRAGIASVLVLAALGVEREKLREDYFLSNLCAAAQLDSLAAERGFGEEDRKDWEKLFFVYPEFVDVFFDSVDADYGGLEGYIHQRLGITEQEIQLLREYYTE